MPMHLVSGNHPLPTNDPFAPRAPTIDELRDTVVLPRLNCCECGTPTTNADGVCDTCERLAADEFGRVEERLEYDTRPVCVAAKCPCGLCRTIRSTPK